MRMAGAGRWSPRAMYVLTVYVYDADLFPSPTRDPDLRRKNSGGNAVWVCDLYLTNDPGSAHRSSFFASDLFARSGNGVCTNGRTVCSLFG